MTFINRFKRKEKKYTAEGYEIQGIEEYGTIHQEYRRLREESRRPLPPAPKNWQGPRKGDSPKPTLIERILETLHHEEPAPREEPPRTVPELLGETKPRRLSDKILRIFKRPGK